MKVLIFLTLAGLAAAIDYEHVLQSPEELKNLFNEFTVNFGKAFSPSEGPMRLRLFRNDLKQIVRLNKEQEWVSGKHLILLRVRIAIISNNRKGSNNSKATLHINANIYNSPTQSTT